MVRIGRRSGGQQGDRLIRQAVRRIAVLRGLLQRVSPAGWPGAMITTGVVLAAIVGAGPARATPPVETRSCSATAHVEVEWGTGTPWAGQIVNVVVRNNTSGPLPKWWASWSLAPHQDLGQGWGAQVTTSAGTLTATNLDPSQPLKPGQSVAFGVRLNGAGPVPVPTCRSTERQPGRTVTVGEADSGQTVSLAVGDTLAVSLGADYAPLSAPSGTAGALVPVTSTGGYPTVGPLSATYRAAAGGEVDLRTTTDYACLHTQPRCTVPVRLWTVHVVVIP